MNGISGVSRRDFVKGLAVAGVATGGLNILTARGQGAGKKLKVGLIGCGGRGGGALENCLEAAKIVGVELIPHAFTDVQADRAQGQAKKYGVPAERCFTGFDGYRKVVDSGVDMVILATSPNFRPLHLEAAIQAGKHVFTEKPVAVDPPGARKFIAVGEQAAQKGLSIVAGTQRRYQKGYLENAAAIKAGAVGRILGGQVYWCGGALWKRNKEQNDSDAMYLVKNWVSFTEMSGDHIVEQHVHNLDIANWFLGRAPRSALGFGGRARRKTGNQFDFFSLDLDYGDGVHIHSMCRQINGTDGGVREFFIGTDGEVPGGGRVKGKAVSLPEIKVDHDNPYVNEHCQLFRSILAGTPINDAKAVAEATLTAIMGRIAAYTGKMVQWADVMTRQDSPFFNLTLAPAAADFEKGAVTAPKDDVPAVPGEEA